MVVGILGGSRSGSDDVTNSCSKIVIEYSIPKLKCKNNFVYCTFETLPVMSLFGSEIPTITEPLELSIGCRFVK
uniref:Uncharacterized protein n=1 Tax=Rhizophagus irregularis (strain DAOM 181602 / DAOM 197198 / MUCL 43194) TaxID=747089 RepID=U9TJ21_RHIID